MLSRRKFLEVSAAAGGGLLIGFNLFGCKDKKSSGTEQAEREPDKNPESPPAEATQVDLNAWIRIGSDDRVTLIVSEAEMGQGVVTALPMILADELGADWDRISTEFAPADRELYGRQGTGGSTSVRRGFVELRKTAAAARHMLAEAAAARWKVKSNELAIAEGIVSHEKSDRRATFGELASAAAEIEPPEAPKLKDDKELSLVGQPTRRLDSAAKAEGKAVFGIDVKVPGMRVAQVAHCPIFGGSLKSIDGKKALEVPGVRQVVEIPTGVAVVADHFWAAHKGAEALAIEWDDGGFGDLDSAAIRKQLVKKLKKGVEVRKEGAPKKKLRAAKRKVSATYEVPYLAHAPMEPLNCTADVRKDRAEVWVATQAQSRTHDLVVELTGLAPDKVKVHTTFLGGGFGRRSQTDFVADAVHVSKAIGEPVKVIWNREDDVRGGFYRPTALNELAGAVDDEGWPSVWVHRIASPSIIRAMGRELRGGIDGTSVEGAGNLPYGIPDLHVTWADIDLPITLWFWRSVGSSQNAFVTECFLDELAALGGKDPVEVRKRLLADKPRHARVLEVAAEKAGWGKSLAEGRAHGVAVHESFGSFVAQVAEVSLEGKQVRVHRVVCAVDCGQVVNPMTVEAQMESGIAYGLSAALYGKLTVEGGRVVEGNFDRYQVVRMRRMPRVDTHLVPSGDAHGGVGEPGTPPIAPAVANAVFKLTGKPVRSLPIQVA